MILPTNCNLVRVPTNQNHGFQTSVFFKKTGVPRLILPPNYNFAGSSHKLRTIDFKLSFF